jgi:hypothetical protein
MFLASTSSAQIAKDASATRTVRILIIVIVKYDWLLCALISSCLIYRAEFMHVPLLLLRRPSRLNCASMLKLLLFRKGILSVP